MKKIFVLMVVFVSAVSVALFAENDEARINMELIVPEDYGVFIPENVLRLDRLIFATEIADNEYRLLERNVDVFTSLVDEDGFTVTLIYYGNLSTPYTVTLDASSAGFAMRQGDRLIPIDLAFRSPDTPSDQIVTDFVSGGEITFTVLPGGPVTGEAAAVLDVSWPKQANLVPGIYEAVIDIRLTSM